MDKEQAVDIGAVDTEIEQKEEILEQLKHKKNPGAEDAEALAALLRQYLAWRCAIRSQGQTVAEIAKSLAATSLTSTDQKKFIAILRQCETWEFSAAPIAVSSW